MSTFKKKLMASFVTIALSTTGVMAATASSPAYAAGGTASCAMNEIVGIWIEVDGGRSGWANRKLTNNPRINQWSYDTQGKRWSANVGCGGTPQNWRWTIGSNWTFIQGAATISCADYGYLKTCRIG